MRLLLDQNLPRRLVSELRLAFPETRHVADVGLSLASDKEIWAYARRNHFAILSKDADFHHLSFRHGAPPKIIWIKLGNCTTQEILECLRSEQATILAFAEDEYASLLVLPHSLF